MTPPMCRASRPPAMIFVPCRDGISHNEAEFSSKEQCAAGAQVLLQAVLDYDRGLAERHGEKKCRHPPSRPSASSGLARWAIRWRVISPARAFACSATISIRVPPRAWRDTA